MRPNYVLNIYVNVHRQTLLSALIRKVPLQCMPVNTGVKTSHGWVPKPRQGIHTTTSKD